MTGAEGRHAVLEALRAGRSVDKIYILHGAVQGALGAIRAEAAHRRVPVVECDRARLDAMSPTGVHQGVAAVMSAQAYAELQDILDAAAAAGEPPLLVVCDGLSDPHNLGAVIRTAGAAGAHGVIIPKRRSVSLTAVVAKSAAGALEYVPVARVSNIPSTLEALKKQGVWVFGTAAEGDTPLYTADFAGPTAIVIGAEGEGLGQLTRQRCDYLVSIPMRGRVPSLNASAAAAVVLFEAVRRRTTR